MKILSIQKKIGGLVYHSFSYPYATDRSGKTCTGNIKWENGRFKEYTESNREIDDEIDILFVTHYRIFPIEVKSGERYSTKSLERFKEKYKERIGCCYIIHPKNLVLKDDILCIPPYMTICL